MATTTTSTFDHELWAQAMSGAGVKGPVCKKTDEMYSTVLTHYRKLKEDKEGFPNGYWRAACKTCGVESVKKTDPEYAAVLQKYQELQGKPAPTEETLAFRAKWKEAMEVCGYNDSFIPKHDSRYEEVYKVFHSMNPTLKK